MLIGKKFSGFKVVIGNHLSIYASELRVEKVRAFNALICNFSLLTSRLSGFSVDSCINEEEGYLELENTLQTFRLNAPVIIRHVSKVFFRAQDGNR